LSPEELRTVGTDYFEEKINCRVCPCSFSIQQGVKESFSIDNPFVIHDFQSNYQENGAVEINVGQLKVVEFRKPFENKPTIYLTPYEKPVIVVPGLVSNSRFSIFSYQTGADGELRQLSWSAYGNRAQSGVPIWRKLLSSSKDYQLDRDFRSEVVYLESALEIFVAEFLGDRLKHKLRNETIDWILGHGITEILRAGFREVESKPLSQLMPKAYSSWERHLRDLRNSVIHRGQSVDSEQARAAREATFEIITRINPASLEHFKIQRIL